jgi:hypothetical protein
MPVSKWANWMSSQLAGAGIEVRVVDLGLSRKGEDLGDWIVERRVNQQASVSDVIVGAQRSVQQCILYQRPS